jgi:hypothetical protein
VTISKFDKSLLIEQIRYIETEQPLACDNEDELADLSSHQDFQQRLWLRAQQLVRQHDLSGAVSHAARLSSYIKIFMLILVALLGAMGAVYAITDTHTINIYWLLLVLLGFNFISMLIWLIGISLNMEGLIGGVSARLTQWLQSVFQHRNTEAKAQTRNLTALADRSWMKCSYSATVGKWQLSKIVHQLWLVYLLAGLGSLLLMLMVRQYDFVWGTTLLSDSAFVSLSEFLSQPLSVMGFSTPTVEQVQASRLGATLASSAEIRASWAQFLLGSLLLYGILPRGLLLVWSMLMSARARALFKLDLYLPYYINLRQRLMPLASHGQVVDADTSPPAQSETSEQVPASHPLPEQTKWAAVELGDNISWPISSIGSAENLGQVIDRETLASTLQHIQQNSCNELAVAVAASRSPDRGIQRAIASLVSNCKQRWLVLLHLPDETEASSKRLAAWYRLAEACDIPADQVISLSVV